MSSKEKANTNGDTHKPPSRADEAADLLTSVQSLITTFIRAADTEQLPNNKPVILDQHPPKDLQQLLNFSLPQKALGKEGFLTLVESTLKHSVNTWSQGFLDKLYASTTPVGLAADLLLSTLNTNVHVYQVSPALTVIEKETCRALAGLFGLEGEFAGGVSQPGGSAANSSSLVIAMNVLFPEIKRKGLGGRKLVIFTSEHGHYSLKKAAGICGLGFEAVKPVPVDERGRMRVDALEDGIRNARAAGEEPFYVNSTAGTTVLGSFDPIDEIADVCEREKLWLHVDGSWGGSIIFSRKQKHKLKGVEKADSIAICAHKMLNVPLTCSFLLGKDLREFHQGMTLPASYLFHNSSEEEGEFWDLADLTPQCGRRGDSLKLALSWLYYGTAGLEGSIDHAFETTAYLANLIAENEDFSLVSENPPPCLQVCFYYRKEKDPGRNSEKTEAIARGLVKKGFMTDFAEGEEGRFLRVVVNCQTRRETVEALVRAIEEVEEEL